MISRVLDNIETGKVSVLCNEETYEKFKVEIERLRKVVCGEALPAVTKSDKPRGDPGEFYSTDQLGPDDDIRVIKTSRAGKATYSLAVTTRMKGIPVAKVRGLVVPCATTRQRLLSDVSRMVDAFDQDIICWNSKKGEDA